MGRVSVNVDVGVNVIEIPALFLRHLIYPDNSTWTCLSYDAWGRRRNAADGSYDSVSVAEPVEAAFAVPEKVRSFVL